MVKMPLAGARAHLAGCIQCLPLRLFASKTENLLFGYSEAKIRVPAITEGLTVFRVSGDVGLIGQAQVAAHAAITEDRFHIFHFLPLSSIIHLIGLTVGLGDLVAQLDQLAQVQQIMRHPRGQHIPC